MLPRLTPPTPHSTDSILWHLQFREWIDDLLVTSWDACQGTDLVIESPSAMGGIHIAEGLGVPYYRALYVGSLVAACCCRSTLLT